MKVKMTMRYALAAMALAICSVQVTQPAIQKIKKVSKPAENQKNRIAKEWTVSIYQWDGRNKIDLVSRSTFKRDTDGFLTNKLYFDFGENNNIANQIVITDNKNIDQGFVCQRIVYPFEHVENLTLSFDKDCTPHFTPNILKGSL